MDLGLQDRVVLVTGSTRGIGRAAAVAFARAGAHVAVTYRTDRDRAEAVAWEIRAAGRDALVVFFDLGSAEAIEAAASAVQHRWGRVDVLVNNAVRWPVRTAEQSPLFESLHADEWCAILRANVDGAMAMIQAVVPSMRRHGWGRIVNVSSGIAADGLAGVGAYGAAKAALHGLTRTLAKELGPDGILVNVVMPGLTVTERSAAHLPAEVRDRMARGAPIRLLQPEEIAPTILFLASAVNSAVTGEIIRVSG